MLLSGSYICIYDSFSRSLDEAFQLRYFSALFFPFIFFQELFSIIEFLEFTLGFPLSVSFFGLPLCDLNIPHCPSFNKSEGSTKRKVWFCTKRRFVSVAYISCWPDGIFCDRISLLSWLFLPTHFYFTQNSRSWQLHIGPISSPLDSEPNRIPFRHETIKNHPPPGDKFHINKKEVTLYLLHLSPTSDKGHFSTFLVSSIIFIPRFLLFGGFCVPLCDLNIPYGSSDYKTEWCTNRLNRFCTKHRFVPAEYIRYWFPVSYLL